MKPNETDWARRLFRYSMGLFVLVVAGALVILVLDRWIMPAYTGYNQGITVPDVTKLELEEAQTTLELYGLRHEVMDRRAHSAFPADFIIDQAPVPGQIVKPDRKVYLTVNSAETATVEVPDLVNMSLRNARIQLENYGLRLGTTSYESSRFRNTILRQSVPPGETVEQGTAIDLAVSDGLGEEMVSMPDLEGLHLTEAQQRLSEAGLRLGPIRYQPTRDVAPNTVIGFSPNQPEIQEGERVNLVVSEHYDAEEVDEAGVVIEDEDGQEIDPDPFPGEQGPDPNDLPPFPEN